VDRIILLSGDMDMAPAIKLARREGIRVAVTQIGGARLPDQLIEDADLVRTIVSSLEYPQIRTLPPGAAL